MAGEAGPGSGSEAQGGLSDDPLARLTKLRQRIVAVFVAHGLTVEEVAVIPAAAADAPHSIHIVASAADEAPKSCTDEFEAVLRSTHIAEIELRAQRAQEDLRRTLEQGGGFLPPPPSGDP